MATNLLPEEIIRGWPSIKEEFYLLCMLRFGMDTLKYPNDHEVFGDFRREIYPDYFNDSAIPTLDLADYVCWCRAKQQEKQHAGR